MDRILTGVIATLMLVSLTAKTSAQVKVRGASIGFSSAVTTGERFGIKATLGDGSNGLTEGEFFKIGSGFIFADPQAKVPSALEEGVGVPGEIPADFELHQNYPNPFNPVTSILISIPNASRARLEVYNMIGQRLAVLVDQDLPAGTHHYEWDATDVVGQPVSSGVYLYRLVAGEYTSTRTMTLLK
jgi:hypothetical protein